MDARDSTVRSQIAGLHFKITVVISNSDGSVSQHNLVFDMHGDGFLHVGRT